MFVNEKPDGNKSMGIELNDEVDRNEIGVVTEDEKGWEG